MAYTITLTNGTQLGTVPDGSLVNTWAGLFLIGKGYKGFGTAFNDNLIRLVENFSNNISPSNPLVGQLWFDSTNNILKVYNTNSVFSPISVSTSSATAPSNPNEGDQWYNTINEQLYVYSGTSWVLIGPTSQASSGTNGIITLPIIQNSSTYYVAALYADGRLVGIVSSDSISEPTTTGFGNLRPGINFVTSASANIVTGGAYNLSGLSIGQSDQFALTVDSNGNGLIQLTNNLTTVNALIFTQETIGSDIAAILPGANVQVSLGSPTFLYDKIYANSFVGTLQTGAVGLQGQVQFNSNNVLAGCNIFVNNSNITCSDQFIVNGRLNVIGDTILSGNLIVTGFQNIVNTSSFSVEDPVIDLGNGSNGNILTINDGRDRGIALHYFQGSAQTAFLGYQNSSGDLIYYSNTVENNGVFSGTVGNIQANFFLGTATSALYADLAERYETDKIYPEGTIVKIGGEKEITAVSELASKDVFGVISAKPAMLMNAGAGTNSSHPAVALVGKIPIRVIGNVKKGDRLISSEISGVARATIDGSLDSVFAYALENNNDLSEKLVLGAIK